MNRQSILIFLVFGMFTTATLAALGQRVAVVLSGGGAKGLAHIGAIKALEEHGIPIDYVVGTSMGGVVGGFYAAGYSPEELEKMASSEAFQSWVTGKISPSQTHYFSQAPITPSWLTLGIHLDSSFTPSFTSNFANDLSLNFTLTTKLAQASQRAGNQFDSLFVPFRTTGSEVFSQEKVVFRSGNLGEAVRVTMTVPLFYRPIKVDGRYLFDGGIYNNLPVDIAIEDFDPDVVVAVNVSDKTFDSYPEQQDEALVSQAVIYALLGKSDTTQGSDRTVYVHPDISPYSAIDFDASVALQDSGYRATLRVMDRIKSRIDRYVSPAEVQRRRAAFLADTLPLQFNRLRLKGFTPKQQTYIRRFFGINQGDLSLSQISDRYYKLVTHEYFQRVVPRVSHNASDRSFDFEIRNARSGTFHLTPGGSLSTRSSFMFMGLSYTRLDRLLTTFHANAYTGGFYKSFQLGVKTYIPSNPHIYLHPTFTLNSWDFLDADDFLVETAIPTIIQQTDRKLGIKVGLPAGVRGKWEGQFAVVWNRDLFSNNEAFETTDKLDELKFEGLRLGIRYKSNTLNRRQYPSEGRRVDVSADYIEGTETYEPGSTSLLEQGQEQAHQWLRLRAQASHYLPMGKVSLGYQVEGVLSSQRFFSNYLSSLLYASAAQPFEDSRTLFLQNFRAQNYLMGGMEAIYAPRKNLEFRLGGQVFMPFWKIEETLDQQPRLARDQYAFSAAATAALVYHSPIGPVALRTNYYRDPETPFTILAHLGFLLFNRRSLE